MLAQLNVAYACDGCVTSLSECVCVCEWNFTWCDQLLQNQKVNNGTTMCTIKCTICFIVTIVNMKISFHFVCANRFFFALCSVTNNDNWHLQWHQSDATADINTSQYIYKFWATGKRGRTTEWECAASDFAAYTNVAFFYCQLNVFAQRYVRRVFCTAMLELCNWETNRVSCCHILCVRVCVCAPFLFWCSPDAHPIFFILLLFAALQHSPFKRINI